MWLPSCSEIEKLQRLKKKQQQKTPHTTGFITTPEITRLRKVYILMQE